MSSVIALPAMIVLAIIFCLPILVGVYVYRDAVRRNMSAGLWALAAALVPAFIGLIVYLLVRSEYADLRCPRCAAPVAADCSVCPKCGAKLRACCPHCKTPVEPDWKVCPRCAEELPADQSDVLPPVRAGGSMDWKMLVVVVGVPVLLILLLYCLVGRAWIAIRENTHAAGGMGINVTKYKVMSFAVSAFYTAFAGAMYAHLVNYIGPDTFAYKQSVMFVTMMLFGGTGSIAGPATGAVLLLLMTESLRVFEQYQVLLYGCLLLIVVVALPGGIYGAVRSVFNKVMAKRKGGQ